MSIQPQYQGHMAFVLGEMLRMLPGATVSGINMDIMNELINRVIFMMKVTTEFPI